MNDNLFSLSPLEPRVLLSGNVTVTETGGNVTIVGDGADNGITIDQLALDSNQLRISHRGTLLNGEIHPIVVDDFTGDIRIRLLGGDDRLVIRQVDVRGQLHVQLGEGADRAMVDGGAIDRRLRLTGWRGRDEVSFSGTRISGPSRLFTGPSDDLVILDDCAFRRDFSLQTREGEDTISLLANRFNSGKTIDPGRGDDFRAQPIQFKFNFNRGRQGWKPGFADYSADTGVPREAGIAPLPDEIAGDAREAFRISGQNNSSDLFMFLRRSLTSADGVAVDQRYRVLYRIALASNAPSNAIGIGGPPGEGVYLKAGAGAKKPRVVMGPYSHLQMNVEHGLGENSFTTTVGHIANGLAYRGPRSTKYVSLDRRVVHQSTVRSGDDGRLWLLVGTDSGTMGRTTLYYQRIQVVLIPLAG